MRKIIISIIILFQYISLHAQVCELEESRVVNNIPKCHNGPLVLVFEDNFDDTVLNENVWTIQEGVVRDFEFSMQKAYHSKDNIKLENGMLEIISKNDTFLNQEYYFEGQQRRDSFYYSTGEIWTNSLFSVNTVIEARIKLPSETGLWPAFWMYGESNGEYREIDIFEYYTFDDKIASNVHYKSRGDNRIHNCEYIYDTAVYKRNFLSEFRTYKLCYLEDRIQFFIDDVLVRTISKYLRKNSDKKYISRFCYNMESGHSYYKRKYFPEGLMHIILNTAVEVNPREPLLAFVSDTMFVDYVRVYKIQECEEDISIRNTPVFFDNCNYRGQNNVYNEFITGKTVDIECNFRVLENHSITTIASQDVLISPDSEIITSTNGEFECKVQPCLNRKIEIKELYYGLDDDDDVVVCDSCDTNFNASNVYMYSDSIMVVDTKYSNEAVVITDSLGNIVYRNDNIGQEPLMINIENFLIGIYYIAINNFDSSMDENFMLNIE